MAEGIGLYLEKAWGEYLTLAITVSFLPLEIFEIVRRLTWIRGQPAHYQYSCLPYTC